MTTPVKLVIFDCDGVLIDSEVLSMQTWQLLLAEQGVTLTKNYFIEEFLGKSMAHVVASVKTDFNVVLTESDLSRFYILLADAFTFSLRPMKGVKDILTTLNVPFCLATSSSPQRTEHALNCTGLAPFFINNRFTRSMVKRGKPSPDLFLLAARTMDAKVEECLVIEDSEVGLQAASAAKMRALRFVGGSHFDAPRANAANVIVSWQMFKDQHSHFFSR